MTKLNSIDFNGACKRIVSRSSEKSYSLGHKINSSSLSGEVFDDTLGVHFTGFSAEMTSSLQSDGIQSFSQK